VFNSISANKNENKTRVTNYQNDILKMVVKLLKNSLLVRKHWFFKQDSTTAHKAKTAQRWLEINLPSFTPSQNWL